MALSNDITMQPAPPNTGETGATDQTPSDAQHIRKPLKYSGSLSGYKGFDVTPVIGREFPDVQLTDILNDDQKIRDLAITSKLQYKDPLMDRDRANNSIASRRCLLPKSEYQRRAAEEPLSETWGVDRKTCYIKGNKPPIGRGGLSIYLHQLAPPSRFLQQ